FSKLVDDLNKKYPEGLKCATLVLKPEAELNGVKPFYLCFSIDPRFIIGYGLDLDGMARNLEDIYVLKQD
ncbi:MAG: hypoxanthine phosphoribosyltransferase, partial [Muribaculaceae bacterium]|nr:hypoxanthine phosphoribosyltransferase [Muribaculaceae bacterium]